MEQAIIDKIIELRKSNKSMVEIARKLNITKRKVQYWSNKNGLGGERAKGNKDIDINTENFKKRFEDKFNQFIYIKGYVNSESKVIVKCLVCGEMHKRIANCVRNKKVIYCPYCKEREREEKKLKEQELKDKKLQERRREIEKLNEIKKKSREIEKECVECGEKFITRDKKRICCSKECSKKHSNRKKEKRLYKNGDIDNTITLTKLIKRDNSICHICGTKCDINDYCYKGNVFIAGENYPSIDHVIPISKGGLHSWENVKLAHRHCNTIKRDYIYKIDKNNQLGMWV